MRLVAWSLGLLAVIGSFGCQGAKPDERLTRDEMLSLLDGQAISLVPPRSTRPTEDKPLTLRKDQIEALEIGQTGTNNNGPVPVMTAKVSFLVRADKGRYAIDGTVSHRLIEDKRVYVRFDVKMVVKQ